MDSSSSVKHGGRLGVGVLVMALVVEVAGEPQQLLHLQVRVLDVTP